MERCLEVNFEDAIMEPLMHLFESPALREKSFQTWTVCMGFFIFWLYNICPSLCNSASL